jgi:predicted DNA-binding transcriptional regulator AlpA
MRPDMGGNSMVESKLLLTKREAADALGLSLATVDRMIASGELERRPK